ncbi:MAG: HIT family protein [Schleiferiaceae bacterium]|nr:HIT family protein [Schleiferiaceae bacterium]
MASIFTKISHRELPGYIVAEDAVAIAFLDVFPLAKGHVLVVPKQEVDNLFDLDDVTYAHLMGFAKKVANGMRAVLPCERVGVAVIGLEVPHAHIHLIPINNVSDIDFSRPKLKFSVGEMEEVANCIRQSFA